MGFSADSDTFASKKTGSVLLLSILICAFIAALAVIFTKQSREMLEYRTEVQMDNKTRVEAYSFLDLALASLSKHYETDTVPYLSSSTREWNAPQHVNSVKNGLAFYKDIIVPESPNDDRSIEKAIGEYLTKCVFKTASAALATGEEMKLESRDLETLKGYPQVSSGKQNMIPMIHHQCQQGNFDVYYSFEDLSSKLPLCATFHKKNKSLVNAALESVSSEYSDSAGTMADYLTKKDPKTFRNWSDVQAALGNVTEGRLDLLKRLFTVDREVLEHAENSKINLITAHENLLDVISNNLGLLTSLKSHARDASLLKDLGTRPNASLYTDQTHLFKLGVHVVRPNGGIFQLYCYGAITKEETPKKRNWEEKYNEKDKKDAKKPTTTPSTGTSSRFRFNLQRIEEI